MPNYRDCCDQPYNQYNPQMMSMPIQQNNSLKPIGNNNMQMMPNLPFSPPMNQMAPMSPMTQMLPMKQMSPMNQIQPMNQMSPSAQMSQSSQLPQNIQTMPYSNSDMQLPLALPSGYPTGPSPTPLTPAAVTGLPASISTGGPPPETLVSPLYTPGFLRTLIGKRIRIEFLMGTGGTLIDRTGTLMAVGVSYVLIQPTDTDDLMMCDIYSIRFVTALL